jgi:hypothetical protein
MGFPVSWSGRALKENDQCVVLFVAKMSAGGLAGDICHDDLVVRDISALRLQCSYSCTDTDGVLGRRGFLLGSVVEVVVHAHLASTSLHFRGKTHMIRNGG